jgi:adenylosuccinate synthase
VHLDQVYEEYLGYAKRLKKYITDTTLFLNQAVDKNKKVLAEGAQGTHLDVDHGTYPFVTSSSPTAGGACTGLGIGPNTITEVMGIEGLHNRVGSGPFPRSRRTNSVSCSAPAARNTVPRPAGHGGAAGPIRSSPGMRSASMA